MNPPPPQPSQPAEVPPEWTYSRHRATLKRDGIIFAIVSPNGKEALDPEDEAILLTALNAKLSPPSPVAEGEVKAAIEYWRQSGITGILHERYALLLCTEVERLTAENIQLSEIREETVLICEQLNSENSELAASLSRSQQESLELAAQLHGARELLKRAVGSDEGIDGSEVEDFLKSSPSPALAEHDAKVREEALEEAEAKLKLADELSDSMSYDLEHENCTCYSDPDGGCRFCSLWTKQRNCRERYVAARQPQTQQEGK